MPRSRRPSPQSNRIDTLSPEAPTAAPNQAYGEAGQQLAAQRTVPLAGAPTMQGAGVPPPQQPQNGAPAGGPGDLLAMAQAHNGPGNSLALDRPTERPNEPVTHGLPGGPGAGPEALTGVGAAARDGSLQQGTLSNLLTSLASQPTATAAVRQLAMTAQAGSQ